MGDGTEKSPYTRKDVLRLIADNGGTAAGLNLSGKWFEEGIDLNRVDLNGIILKDSKLVKANLQNAILERSILAGSHLTGANLQGAFLESSNLKGARLSGANLTNAHCFSACLEKAHLTAAHLNNATMTNANLTEALLNDSYLDSTGFSYAQLQGVSLMNAKILDTTEIHNADWGNYIIAEEKRGEKKGETHFLSIAADIYRKLKILYTNAGMYAAAGEFYYREKEATRKRVQAELPAHHKLENIWNFLWLWIYKLLCGYGEKTLRIVGWAAFVIVGLALAYFIINSVWEWSDFWKSLYFSAVSFTSLGYGGWIDEKWININNNWIKGLGVSESFIGVFMTGLFLVTFTRKMTR